MSTPLLRLTVLIGHLSPGSRTARTAVRAAGALGAAVPHLTDPAIVDLAVLASRLFATRRPPEVTRALDTVTGSRVLLVATPAVKGSYTGLLKAFLDQLPPDALAGTLALPLLVTGLARHALALDVHLRPLLVELGATVPTPGLVLLEQELTRVEQVLNTWAAAVAPAVRGLARGKAAA